VLPDRTDEGEIAMQPFCSRQQSRALAWLRTKCLTDRGGVLPDRINATALELRNGSLGPFSAHKM